MLKILYVLLKVLILIKANIALSSDDVGEPVYVTHYTYQFSNMKRVENYIDNNYIDNVTVRNEIENVPSEPTSPRVFIQFESRLDKKSDIIVRYRWEEPKFINGKIQKYTVRYWDITKEKYINFIHNILSTEVHFKVPNLPSSMMYFQVQAHNENGAGPYTKFSNVSSTHENPVPLLLISSSDSILLSDIDLLERYELNKYRTKEIIYSALEHKLYWINEVSELISYDFNANTMKTNDIYTKIVDLDSSAHNLCVDWIARNLYWIQDAYHTKNIMKLDLTLWEQTGLAKYDSILQINESKFLNIVPLKGYIYWMELNSNNQYVIRQSDLDGKNNKSFLEDKNNKCFCPYKLQEASTMQIDNTNIDEPLMYWTSKDHLIAGDIYGCRCHLILSAGNEKFFNYLTIDKTNIYLFSKNELQSRVYLYTLNKKYALIESNENAFIHVPKDHGFKKSINSVIALDVPSPYPPITCLTPKAKNYAIKVTNITANSIVVNLPEPDSNDGCEKYNLPTTIYIISISHCLDNDLNKFKKSWNEQTHKNHYEIKNLTPFTEYKLKLALSNFYVDKLSMNLQFGEDVTQKTNPGNFNAPENVTVQVLTPTLAKIYWMPLQNLNCAQVNYEVHWKSILFSNGTQKIIYQEPHIKQLFMLERTVDGKFFTIIQSLLPGHEYSIYVRVYPANFNNFFNDSVYISVHMYSEPNNLTLSGISTNSMAISWIPSHNLIDYKLEYKNVTMQVWEIADDIEKNNDKVIHYIKNLQPGTFYNFRLILKYPEHMEDFIWPLDERVYAFKTLDISSAPGRPMLRRLSNSTHQLQWIPAQVQDSQIILYRLEGLIVENNYKEDNQSNKHWNLYYNGTDNHWIITENMNQKYLFRVKAGYAYDFGLCSETSAVIDLTESIEILAAHYYYYYLLLPFVLSLIVTLAVYNVYYFYCSYGQCEEINDSVLPAIMTDIKLITHSELSCEDVQLNKLYDSRLQHNLDKFNLKIIEKERITLTKLLGSGQFGNVFRGTVKNLEGLDTMPVAIKMPRENASSQDKEKFLQEAKLMSHFRHKNVLRLLCICLDTDSPMLILELMTANLLKYLRESQTLQSSDPHSLRLQDLFAMCEDVARGCCYLEKLHFVHRDLACRNCLISTRNRENFIVKISDFGLARDLYKNACYHMKGEDLLPFRWMAPESLQHRKFTTQSDVWSFGVLMWEITSLGQHPYSAKNDTEVMQYVCAGGKLPKPLNCPLALYQLMQQCWSAVDNRPNFIKCLENIITLRDNTEDAGLILSNDFIKYAELPSSGQLEDFVESTT